MKKILNKYHADEYPMGKIKVKQPLPHRGLQQIDPFLLLHHVKSTMPGGQKAKDKGVPPHPHRGFAPVTFVFDGGVHHRDSIGNSSKVTTGGVQWMNAGKGVVHSERPTKEAAEKGGAQEFIQLWVNVPKKNKMKDPNYQGLKSSDFPKVWKLESGSYLDLVVGKYKEKEGPAKAYTDILAFKGEFKKEGESFEVEIPEGYNSFLYLLNGELKINGDTLKEEYLANFSLEGGKIKVTSVKAGKFLILSGKPINEKVVTYGPFVMNSQQEIMQAFQDYEEGRMGKLVETFE